MGPSCSSLLLQWSCMTSAADLDEARLRQDWSTEHPGDEVREQCGLPRPPGLGGGDHHGSGLGDTSPHGGRGPSARHRGSAADGASNGGGAHHQNGIGASQQELNRSSTHPAVSLHATVKTRSTPRRAGGHDSGGGAPGEPLRQGPHNPLRQRSVGWSGEAAHGDGAVSEQLRRGSLPELGVGAYSAPGGAPVMHRTSWHGQQQQQQQQVMSQMLALGAQPPPPPPSPHQHQQQHFAGLLPGPPLPPPPRVLSPHARVAQTVSQGINGCKPMVPFGSPMLRSRLAYGGSVGSQSLDHTGFSVPAVSPQAGAFDDSALNMLLQAQMGLDGDVAPGDGQARSRNGSPAAHSGLCSGEVGACLHPGPYLPRPKALPGLHPASRYGLPADHIWSYCRSAPRTANLDAQSESWF